jgi:plasmid stabilization system protein ParE
LLRDNPDLGKVYARIRTGSVRRILLSQTEYHLYYRYRADRKELDVLAVWGAARVPGPKFGRSGPT